MVEWNSIQEKWQQKWNEAGVGKAQVSDKEKFFMIFAYPGVSGFLHVGHMRGFSYTDAICRYERLQGKEVLFPVGTHASGNQAIAFANKVKNNDAKWVDYLRRNGCSEETLKTLVEPEAIINYFNEVYVEEYWKKFGFLCDWDRFACTTTKDYEKFIQWQFMKLHDKELLTQKPYYAPFSEKCGPVAIDPSETDLSKGGNAEKVEYTLLKFAHGEKFLVAATLRPETVYGQTNLWINPDAIYVSVTVGEEEWIVSKEAAEKLQWQKDQVTIGSEVDIIELFGKTAIAPGIKREIPILPATFCDPLVGTGVVTCVPGDAPYDYVALTTLQNSDGMITKYGLDAAMVKAIKPIPIITSKGYGEFPAQEIVTKMGITSLEDPKLDDATKEIYKAGHHTGVMRDNAEEFAGKHVEEAKELMKARLLEEGAADLFYDLSEEVVCRFGGRVFIKKIDDQWFIKYSDHAVTEQSKEHVQEMNVYPKEYKDHLPGILDWFSDRACARLGNWLGSKFPYNQEWTIEPISDSTLYPSYYIVSKYVKEGIVEADDLTEEFFDYVFLGKGEGQEHWKPIRKEFEYFYPLDINLGGKEHKTVHFPVFLMNHIALLPREKWPQGIFVNWWVTGKGSKISKSKGGAEPIPNAIEKYGVDAMRLYYAHIGSPHVDVVWTEETVFHYKSALERIYNIVGELQKLEGGEQEIDAWLRARVNHHIVQITAAMKHYDLRELTSTVYFTLYDDVKWYLRRGGKNKELAAWVIDVWTRLMNPVTPHLSEELYQGEGFASTASWPTAGDISHKAFAGEDLVKNTMEGMRNVVKLAKLEKSKKFTLFIAQDWLYDVFKIVQAELGRTRNMGEIMRVVLAEETLAVKGKEISKVVAMLLKDPSKLPHHITSKEHEENVLADAIGFLEEEFDSSVEIVVDGEHAKAKAAMPGKVGLLVE